MSTPAATVQQLRRQSIAHTTQSEGCRIVWQQWPAANSRGLPPLVLLHGGFGSWTHWIRNVGPLSKGRDVWTMDLPGLGESGDMPTPWTTEHFARLVLLGLNRVVGARAQFQLAGFSFGAMIAAHLAAQAGERCSRLTLIGAAGCGQLHVQVPLLTPPGPDCPASEADMIQRENLARLMLYRPDSIDDLAVHIHAVNLARHRFRSRKLSRSDDLLLALPAVKSTLVGVWGAQDATAGGRHAIAQREALLRQHQPDCEFHVLDAVGHWAMYEAAEKVNHILEHH